MTRKLATITKVASIFPIDGADFIEGITMEGNSWQCVVKKGENEVGSRVVYFEIDSWIPASDNRFDFLNGNSNKVFNGIDGYRLKTVKRKKIFSQGLALPLSQFPEIENRKDGDDVTKELGILLYEVPEVQHNRFGNKQNTPAKKFPYFIPKTDQERIQSFDLERLKKMENDSFEITIKMDGSSETLYVKDGIFGFCSRNLELYTSKRNSLWTWIRRLFIPFRNKIRKNNSIVSSVYEHIAIKYNIEKKLLKYHKDTGRNIAIQGEVVGVGIQSNFEKIPNNENRFFVYDIFDIDKQKYLQTEERLDIVESLGLEHVPILEKSAKVLQPFEGCIQRILDMADGKGLYTDRREGLVFKSQDNTDNSFKAISNSYLLKVIK